MSEKNNKNTKPLIIYDEKYGEKHKLNDMSKKSGGKKMAKWLITVGGGYGSFVFEGTEEEAEEMRKHKAIWEGAVATKKKIDD